MNRPRISIIIPMYNAARYVDRCMSSIAAQDYADFEVLMCDDGSTDDTAAVASVWASRDARFKLISKSNGGVSSARNACLDIAVGYYVTFIDVDDYVDPGYLSAMKPDNDHDFAIQGAVSVFPDRSDNYCRFESLHTCDLRQLLLSTAGFIASPWSKLYKKSIIDRHGLRFSTEVSYGEDKIFVGQYLSHCNTYYISESTAYYYTHDNPSCLTRTGYDAERLYRYASLYDEVVTRLIDRAGLSADEAQIIRFPVCYDTLLAAITKATSDRASASDKRIFLKNIDRGILGHARRNKKLPMRFRLISLILLLFPSRLFLPAIKLSTTSSYVPD